MEAKGGHNILCPFGNGKMMLVDGTLSSGEHEEPMKKLKAMSHPLLLHHLELQPQQ